jgi:serine protease Do
MTKKVIEMAKPYGAAVEAEIGCVGGSEDGSVDIAMRCTSPDQAKHFYEETNVDALAIAIGNALGYGQSVTVGYISAKDRTINVEGNEIVALQTDAAINGGNSGGPLFNTKGEVIGINSAKYKATGVEGMCFAIPISRAIPILNELMTREILAEEEKGFLGVTIKDVTADIAA